LPWWLGGGGVKKTENKILWLRWAADEAVLNIVHKKTRLIWQHLVKKIKVRNAQAAVLTSDKYCK
jgi:hypothetical protein